MAKMGTRDKGAVKGTGRRGTDWAKSEEEDEAGTSGSEKGESSDKIEGVSKPDQGGKETGRSWDDEAEEDMEALGSREVRDETSLRVSLYFFNSYINPCNNPGKASHNGG